MSAICVVNLKEHDLKFEDLNSLAKKIIAFCLKSDLAAFFHCQDYGYELIQKADMTNYFLMSDSFLYKNCEFLDTTMFSYDKDRFKVEFFQKYSFFYELIGIIFAYHINAIEIYISVDPTEEFDDFIPIQTSQNEFLNDLYENFMNCSIDTAFTFPTTKFCIKKSI